MEIPEAGRHAKMSPESLVQSWFRSNRTDGYRRLKEM